MPPPPERPAATPPQPATGAGLALALAGGLVGAIVGGFAWGYLVRSIDTELGIAAIGVGILAGFGVASLARGRRGTPLQVIAALAAALGILLCIRRGGSPPARASVGWHREHGEPGQPGPDVRVPEVPRQI